MRRARVVAGPHTGRRRRRRNNGVGHEKSCTGAAGSQCCKRGWGNIPAPVSGASIGPGRAALLDHARAILLGLASAILLGLASAILLGLARAILLGLARAILLGLASAIPTGPCGPAGTALCCARQGWANTIYWASGREGGGGGNFMMRAARRQNVPIRHLDAFTRRGDLPPSAPRRSPPI